MKINEKTIPGIVMASCVFFMALVLVLSTGITGDTDSITHYLFSRYAFKYPEHFLDHWAKPLFTILSAPFAQLGMTGAMIFNMLSGLLTAWLVYKIARKLLYDYSWAVILMVVFTPVYFINMYTSLTEILFSLVLVGAIYLFLYERYILAALLISLIPFARSEGLMFLPLFLVAFLWMKKYRAIPFLSAGFILFGLLGLPKYGEFWWFFTAMPYSTDGPSIYGSGSFFFYFRKFHHIMGFPLIILALIGTLTMFKWFVSAGKLYRDVGWTTEYLLVLPSFYGYILVQSFLWWQGMMGVLASYRFMACILPLGALIALAGFNVIINNLSYNRVTRNRIGLTILLSVIVMPFVYYKIPFIPRASYHAIEQAADWFKSSSYSERYVYYFDPAVAFFLDEDPWDRSRLMEHRPDVNQPENSYADSAVIFWESSFGTYVAGITFEKLFESPHFRLLNVFTPRKDHPAVGGGYYFVAVFEKGPADYTQKEFLPLFMYDFEKDILDDRRQFLTDSIFVSPDRAYKFPGKGYSPGLDLAVEELPGKENVFLRISGKFNIPEGYPVGRIILVLEVRDDEGKMYRYLVAKNEPHHQAGEWFELSFITGINKARVNGGMIKVYAWNQAELPVVVDDLQLRYYPLMD